MVVFVVQSFLRARPSFNATCGVFPSNELSYFNLHGPRSALVVLGKGLLTSSATVYILLLVVFCLRIRFQWPLKHEFHHFSAALRFLLQLS